MLSEWQVYRLFAGDRGGWTTFLFLLRERLARAGIEVDEKGRIARSS
jgi:hypothetical protein